MFPGCMLLAQCTTKALSHFPTLTMFPGCMLLAQCTTKALSHFPTLTMFPGCMLLAQCTTKTGSNHSNCYFLQQVLYCIVAIANLQSLSQHFFYLKTNLRQNSIHTCCVKMSSMCESFSQEHTPSVPLISPIHSIGSCRESVASSLFG